MEEGKMKEDKMLQPPTKIGIIIYGLLAAIAVTAMEILRMLHGSDHSIASVLDWPRSDKVPFLGFSLVAAWSLVWLVRIFFPVWKDLRRTREHEKHYLER